MRCAIHKSGFKDVTGQRANIVIEQIERQGQAKAALVCGGLAEYFDIDPTIIRLIAVFLLLPGGFTCIVPYGIMWVVVPENPVSQLKKGG